MDFQTIKAERERLAATPRSERDGAWLAAWSEIQLSYMNARNAIMLADAERVS